jgi:ABC-type amino acid transport substrate-binding protein
MLAILCLTSNRAIAGEMERIIQKGEVVISLNNGYPPFAMVEKDSLQGLDVDLGTMIAEHLGVKARFIC